VPALAPLLAQARGQQVQVLAPHVLLPLGQVQAQQVRLLPAPPPLAPARVKGQAPVQRRRHS